MLQKLNKKQVVSRWHNSKKQRFRTTEFKLQFESTSTGKEEKSVCTALEAGPMSIPCDEASAASMSVWWQVRWVTEGLVTGTLEPFQGSKPLIIKVGCLLPTMVLQNKFGRHDAFFSQAARRFYIRMRPFHKSLTHVLRHRERQRCILSKL